MSKSNNLWRSLSFGTIVALAAYAAAQTVDPSLYSGMVWRNIGPFRGGRVAAVTGVIGQPGVFYMGMPLGGVWKTTSAGTTWVPIMDSVKEASSVGAIDVAPSNPNVIYVGMGDMITGGGINQGNGVYKSEDAGKTWVHLGLDNTKHIPSILVDPQNPDIVMVAANGDMRTKSPDRGLFRSTDGGKSWTKTLYVDDETGVEKIARAPDRPETLLATTMHYYSAAGARFGGRGGAGNTTAVYKSTDEGVTWTKLPGKGLPDMAGRTCVAIANHTDAQRMFIVGNFGLYRSDDGGQSWRQMDAADKRVSNGQGGYNCGVYVDPQNPDLMYVINTCSYRSVDGGNTFTGFKGAPGGDDPQQLWIDPTDGKRMFFGTDQGATISLDGGQSWSSWYNQPTAQVYHISTDNRVPYWVYATQQDSGSIATASRGIYGEITSLDWLPHPGYEFGSIVADPLNPDISYAGGPGGGISRVVYPSGQWIDVSPSADSTLGLRKVGNQPLAFNSRNPHELLAGFQFLMSTTDGGKHWKKLSPDLGYPKGYKPPEAAPAKSPKTPAVATPPPGNEEQPEDDVDPDEPQDQRGPNQGGAIESFSTSSVDGGVIWAGTNNGLIKVTKNHGSTWEDVSIPNLPGPAKPDVSAIDASHQDPGTAYVALDYHNSGDYAPYFYRTRDFGKTWTKIVDGLPTDQPSGSFARVVRADTERKGLIFAGTESSVYVSFDDGDHWQSLMLNLPNTSYRDMQVKNNDLVVGTYGRGFWILDDISPLRQISAQLQSEPSYLFKPGDALRVRRNVNADTPFPPEIPHALNPPPGAIIYYYIGKQPAGPVSLEIKDSDGIVVRHLSSQLIPPLTDPPPPIPDFWVETLKPMPTELGMNRINWDLRYDSPNAFSHNYAMNANPGQTPPSPLGPMVAPGVYTAVLTVDGRKTEQTFTVRQDPRSPVSASELRSQHDIQLRLYVAAKQAWEGYRQVAAMREQAKSSVGAGAPADLVAAGDAFDAKLAAIEGDPSPRRRFFGGFAGFGGQRPEPTFVSVNGSLIRQLGELEYADSAPSQALAKACERQIADLNAVTARWKALNQKELVAFNSVLEKHNLKPTPAAVIAEPESHNHR